MRPLHLLTLLAVALSGACTSESPRPVPTTISASPSLSPSLESPSPSVEPASPSVEPASPTTTEPPPPATTAPAPRRTTTRPPPAPANCSGAVTMEVPIRVPGTLPARCLTVGGLVHLKAMDINNDTITYSPQSATACLYAAAILACRMLAVGTLQFRIKNAFGDRKLTVKVIGVTSPPKPAPACSGVVTETYPIPADGMEYWGFCMRAGSTVRLTGMGPKDLRVKPANLASCRYEAGVHSCRLAKRGTVRLGSDLGSEYKSIVVVVH